MNDDNPHFIVLMSDGELYSCTEDATNKELAIWEAERAFPDSDAVVEAVYVKL